MKFVLLAVVLLAAYADWTDGEYDSLRYRSTRISSSYDFLQLNPDESGDQFGDEITVDIGSPFRVFA